MICQCGHCPVCVHRVIKRRRRARAATPKRKPYEKNLSPEVSDEEMDRRALVMMGRLQA